MDRTAKPPPGLLDAYAAEHPEVTLDLRAWVQDGRGGTVLQAASVAELIGKLRDTLGG